MSKKKPKTVDLRELFLALQKQLDAELSANKPISHPGSKGTATEESWKDLLNEFLPARYRAEKAFVVDVFGNRSDEIDIVIFDRYYSPLLFKLKKSHFIPAESVYAVFEVRQDLTKNNIIYAANKTASVRRLHRTSTKIPDVTGTLRQKKPFRILAGILTSRAKSKKDIVSRFGSVFGQLNGDQQIDLGCSIQNSAYELLYRKKSKPEIYFTGEKQPLLFFYLTLLSRLQQLGNTPAIDFTKYLRTLTSPLKKLDFGREFEVFLSRYPVSDYVSYGKKK